MNNLQIFDNPEFGKIRTIIIGGEPWFVGKDIAVALQYSNPRDALKKHVDEEDKGVAKCDTLSGRQDMSVISEAGIYSLIFSSKLPAAKKFKHWVIREVLPSIRQTGSYGLNVGILNRLVEQMENMTNVMVKVLDRLESLEKKQEAMHEIPLPSDSIKQLPETYYASRCKVETFPKEITEQVNTMLKEMIQQQALNFSMIARFCTINGYTISSPSVKRYFEKLYNS